MALRFINEVGTSHACCHEKCNEGDSLGQFGRIGSLPASTRLRRKSGVSLKLASHITRPRRANMTMPAAADVRQPAPTPYAGAKQYAGREIGLGTCAFSLTM